MTQPKTKFLGCRVVPWLHELATRRADAEGISQAEYVRKLVVKDLRDWGLLLPDRPPIEAPAAGEINSK